ncbi:hypothetical protein HYH03_002272 [Edaphochlamys debaryana]|uniref:Peptidase M11 gametolysin domain-containing protein n=1 Tax=Edaphochlamys debaryana TaxID=47281 RepID=A0A836C4L9_9CHLO|nr:hypothetical protein HYH03_002272 [Edaphochlamys debaryana]|eukprot:KAG2499990.1 hypothetical protein HYH03_002272 [Edaphochlamys debaryana]
MVPGCQQPLMTGPCRRVALAALLVLAVGSCRLAAGAAGARRLLQQPVREEWMAGQLQAIAAAPKFGGVDISSHAVLLDNGNAIDLEFSDTSRNGKGRRGPKDPRVFDDNSGAELVPGQRIKVVGSRRPLTRVSGSGTIAYYSFTVTSITSVGSPLPPLTYAFRDVPSIVFVTSMCGATTTSPYPPSNSGNISAINATFLGGPGSGSISAQFASCSYGTANMSPSTSWVYPTVIDLPCETNVTNTSFCGNLNTYRNFVNNVATTAGVDLKKYRHRVLVIPKNMNCGWAGMAYVGPYSGVYEKECKCLPSFVYKSVTYNGCTEVDRPGRPWCATDPSCPSPDFYYTNATGVSQPSIFCPNGYSWAHIDASYFSTHVVSHELGHNLFMSHGGWIDAEYGDASETMGSGSPACFNAVHQYQAGWSTPATRMNASTMQPGVWYNITLNAAAVNPNNSAIVVHTSWAGAAVSNATRYYVSYRPSNTTWPDNNLAVWWQGVMVTSWTGDRQTSYATTWHNATLTQLVTPAAPAKCACKTAWDYSGVNYTGCIASVRVKPWCMVDSATCPSTKWDGTTSRTSTGTQPWIFCPYLANDTWVERDSSPFSLVVKLGSPTGQNESAPATLPLVDVAVCRRSALIETNCFDDIDEAPASQPPASGAPTSQPQAAGPAAAQPQAAHSIPSQPYPPRPPT